MSIQKGKQRITITVSDESIEKLTMYSKKMGMSRSAICAYLVGQGLMGLDKACMMIDEVMNKMTYEMIENVSRSETE